MKFVSSNVAESLYHLKHGDDNSLSELPEEYRLTLMEPELAEMTEDAAYILPYIMKLLDQCKRELDNLSFFRGFFVVDRMTMQPHGLTQSNQRKFKGLTILADALLFTWSVEVVPTDFIDSRHQNVEAAYAASDRIHEVIGQHPLWSYFDIYPNPRVIKTMMEYADYFVLAPYVFEDFDDEGVGVAYWTSKMSTMGDFIKAVDALPTN